MGIEKVLKRIQESDAWGKYESAKRSTLLEFGIHTPDFTIKKSNLEKKIDDFSRYDGLLIIGNSQRKALIEKEVELNKKKKSLR